MAAWLPLLALAAVVAQGSGAPSRPPLDACEKAVAQAVDLLPTRPGRIRVVDVDPLLPAARARAGRGEAFVVAGDATIYLRADGPTLVGAVSRGGPYVFALAAILWHERAHQRGADEEGAMKAEMALWRSFIVQRRVAQSVGLQYLALLERHRVAMVAGG